MPTYWEWIGPNGQNRRGLSEFKARGLVRREGGIAVEMPNDPVAECAAQVYLPAVSSEERGAESFYGRGSFNGD